MAKDSMKVYRIQHPDGRFEMRTESLLLSKLGGIFPTIGQLARILSMRNQTHRKYWKETRERMKEGEIIEYELVPTGRRCNAQEFCSFRRTSPNYMKSAGSSFDELTNGG